CPGIIGIKRYRLLIEVTRLDARRRIIKKKRVGTQDIFIGSKTRGCLSPGDMGASGVHSSGQSCDDSLHQLVLDGHDFFATTVVTVRPDMPAVGSVDKLRGDAYLRANLAHAAFNYELDPKLSCHLPRVDFPAAVLE